MGQPPQLAEQPKTEEAPVPLTPKAHWALWLWRQIRPLIILVLIMCAVRSSLADWNDVPTGSMKPSILEGDRIFVNKLAYDLKVPFFPLNSTWRIATWSAPKQGEIVVFLKPGDGTRLVKRCIAGPGDTVEVRDNRLLVNGQECKYGPLDPKYRAQVSPDERSGYTYREETMPGGRVHPMLEIPHLSPFSPVEQDRERMRNFGPVGPLGPDQFWMMGDNRDNSGDSRVFGVVDRSLILGRATYVAFSVDLNHNWAPRWSRFFTKLP